MSLLDDPGARGRPDRQDVEGERVAASRPGQAPARPQVRLWVRLAEVTIEQTGPDGRPQPTPVPLAEYRAGEPDPLHPGAAEQLQHLAAHHTDAIGVLTRLIDREALIGATRVLPIALDRYGIVLRVERLRDHRDVRLPFSRRIDTGAEAATEIRTLLALGGRRRPCGGYRD
jgi:hypothetical protein